jgi:signal recognition particle receptor subunit beta
MVQINFAQRQVNAKIVYYGPGMSGKTTNLEVVHQRAPDQNRGELTSISTDGDRTLFFDFMPLDLGTVAGMRTCFQIYTVPGQVYYNSTRKLVLQGVDGVVFVADSSAAMVEDNLESLRNLEENLNEYGKSLATLPHVIQYNKRDLPDALPVDQLNQTLNLHGAPTFEAIASTGQGVFPTLKGLAARVLENIHQGSGGPAPAAGTAQSQPAPRSAPPPPPSLPARQPAPAAAAPANNQAPALQATSMHGAQRSAPAARPASSGGGVQHHNPPAAAPQGRPAGLTFGANAAATSQRAAAPQQQGYAGGGQSSAGEGLHLRGRQAPDLSHSGQRSQPRPQRQQNSGHAAPARSKASSLEGSRFRPRTARPSPRPTPAPRTNKRVVAGVIVALSLVVGAVLAQVVFSLF